MTQPVQEPTQGRIDSGQEWRTRQLFRRPGPNPAATNIGLGIGYSESLFDFSDDTTPLTYGYDADIGPFIGYGVSWVANQLIMPPTATLPPSFTEAPTIEIDAVAGSAVIGHAAYSYQGAGDTPPYDPSTWTGLFGYPTWGINPETHGPYVGSTPGLIATSFPKVGTGSIMRWNGASLDIYPFNVHMGHETLSDVGATSDETKLVFLLPDGTFITGSNPIVWDDNDVLSYYWHAFITGYVD